MPASHRKQVRHIHEAGHLHELTFSCYRRMPLLTNDTWRAMLSESIDRAMVRHDYRLIAYVMMPEHVHLLVQPGREASTISALLKAVKRPYSYRIKQRLAQHDSELLQRLRIRQRPGVSTFRYWQEGPGYDRNITEPSTAEASLNYIHMNPVKRKLCERAVDWKWSSARSYVFPDDPTDSLLPKVERLPSEFWLSD